MPTPATVHASALRRATRNRTTTAGIAIIFVAGVAAIALVGPDIADPAPVTDAAPLVDPAGVDDAPTAALSPRLEATLEARVVFAGGTRMAVDPVTRLRESTWSGEGTLAIAGEADTVVVTTYVDVDAENAPGGFANAVHRGTVEVVGGRSCNGAFAAVWDASEVVADRGAMALECDDGTVIGLTVVDFDLLDDATTITATGFAALTAGDGPVGG